MIIGNTPAFPNITPDMNVPGGPGISKLEYFMAHAPAEPQSWFEPEKLLFTDHRPDMNDFAIDDARRDALHIHLSDPCSDWVGPENEQGYIKAVDAWRTKRSSVNTENQKRYYIQWPKAWAEAQLKQLEEAV